MLLILVFSKSGAPDDHGWLYIGKLTDVGGSVKTVHDRHVAVHEDQWIRLTGLVAAAVLIVPLLNLVYRLLAIVCDINSGLDLADCQERLQRVDVELVVVDDEKLWASGAFDLLEALAPKLA